MQIRSVISDKAYKVLSSMPDYRIKKFLIAFQITSHKGYY